MFLIPISISWTSYWRCMRSVVGDDLLLLVGVSLILMITDLLFSTSKDSVTSESCSPWMSLRILHNGCCLDHCEGRLSSFELYPCSDLCSQTCLFNLLLDWRVAASMLTETLQPGESNCGALPLTYREMSFEDPKLGRFSWRLRYLGLLYSFMQPLQTGRKHVMKVEYTGLCSTLSQGSTDAPNPTERLAFVAVYGRKPNVISLITRYNKVQEVDQTSCTHPESFEALLGAHADTWIDVSVWKDYHD